MGLPENISATARVIEESYMAVSYVAASLFITLCMICGIRGIRILEHRRGLSLCNTLVVLCALDVAAAVLGAVVGTVLSIAWPVVLLPLFGLLVAILEGHEITVPE